MDKLSTLLASALLLTVAALPAMAESNGTGAAAEKWVVALKTDEFELAETDVSHLEVGEAETVYTEDGRTLDILRTEDGVEIYVDGEPVDFGAHGEHRTVHNRVEVICADDGDCEETAWSLGDEDVDALHGGDHDTRVIVIKEKAETD